MVKQISPIEKSEEKVILLGDESVGKTSLIFRFVHEKFESSYKQTLGTEILLKELSDVILQIWDVSGGSFFKRYREKFYKKSKGAFLVFDLTRKKTFENIPEWRNELIDIENSSRIQFILIGNKNDLPDQEVSYEEAKALADSWNIPLILTSALTGDLVDNAFETLAELIKKQV